MPTLIRPVNLLFRKALDYRTYRLSDRSQHYDRVVAKKVAKMAKMMEVQLRSHFFDATDPISILAFLPQFKTACDTNGVHEGAETWLFQFFIKSPAKAALVARIRAPNKAKAKHGRKDGILTSYVQVVNYLLRSYATDEVIDREDTKLHRFSQPDGMNETDYTHVLWENALRFGSVYDEVIHVSDRYDTRHRSCLLYTSDAADD